MFAYVAMLFLKRHGRHLFNWDIPLLRMISLVKASVSIFLFETI